ncbi:unnamed protein product [Spirodela intermedia]|uniref:BZIP domain-containing protein n=1 Tax=Spirodela intermedia TaxID=51605 RepID=A0A7I8L5E9_SPIIN|nr:unnamed protein product [Spirodela intermedia]
MDPNMLPSNPRFGRYPSSSFAVDPAPAFAAQPAFTAQPARGAGHRRAHSETVLRIPDDILFDSDPDFGFGDIELPSLSDDNGSTSGGFPAPQAESSLSEGQSGACDTKVKAERPPRGSHFRSLSVDAAFFEDLGISDVPAPAPGGAHNFGNNSNRRVHHMRSNSMDGSTSSFEAESAPPSDYAKKAMAPERLAELALIDPKKAKRILANRQSAARSKERKIRYTSELERKVQTLQTEATTLSAQLTMLQRDTTGLTTENKELKLRLQAMEQQAHLRDAINEALREELQRLKLATGQAPFVNGNAFSRGAPQYLSQPQQQQQQQQQQQPQAPPPQLQQQLHMLRPASNGNPFGGRDSM